MAFSLGLSPTARGLVTLYISTLLAGMWAMIVPAVPVLAVAFEISPGTAAQIVTASGLGRFVGLPIGGAVLDRLGARSALIAGAEPSRDYRNRKRTCEMKSPDGKWHHDSDPDAPQGAGEQTQTQSEQVPLANRAGKR
jgi:hypothetical protein